MKFRIPGLHRRLNAADFTQRFVREVTARIPHLEVRVVEDLRLRIGGSHSGIQHVELARAFEQYRDAPDEIEEIIQRWMASLLEREQREGLRTTALVPLMKSRRWIEQQRKLILQDHGPDVKYELLSEPYNAELAIVYAEYDKSIKMLAPSDLEGTGLTLSDVRSLAMKNLRTKVSELRITGGGDRVFVICADRNLEPSLILLDEVWNDPRLQVEEPRVVTIPERGFTMTCSGTNPFHVWQLAADAVDSHRKAQYPVSPLVFERRGGVFEVLDREQEDPGHPISDPGNLDIHAIRKGGGSDLVIVIDQPLLADARSVARLYYKIENYLGFVNSAAYREASGEPSPENTSIIVRLHPQSAPEIFDLLESVGEWVKKRKAALVVEKLESVH